MKKITLITASKKVGEFYRNILCNIFENLIEIKLLNFENYTNKKIEKADLYLTTSISTGFFEKVISKISEKDKIILLKVVITKKGIEKIKKIPSGSDTLLINTNQYTTIETISTLNSLGLTNINYYPFYPSLKTKYNIETAIILGNKDNIPNNIKNIIDIGPRFISSVTIAEIIVKLGFEGVFESKNYKEYIEKLPKIDYITRDYILKNIYIENRFNILIESLDKGCIIIDKTKKIIGINSYGKNIIEKHNLDKFIFELSKKIDFNSQKRTEVVLLKIQNIYINVFTNPIIVNNIYLGIFIFFDKFIEEERKQNLLRNQLLGKGYVAKYTFANIVGTDETIINAKKTAEKMSKTDFSILLTGESGTGKELFAHSIHNSSLRKNEAFIAINCAALSESLLESELFGYVKGAFTGAAKEGKIGLLEHAHKGTLFLDEIEGMTLRLQIKLLRVLQEKEIIRVGGNEIIKLDVRIIAASNENLKELVKKGEFRKDLYYRLNNLPINIPPLRERKNDIFVLFEFFKNKIGVDFNFSEEVKKFFKNYKWDGNIRELKNLVEYLSFIDLKTIEIKDLPEYLKEEILKLTKKEIKDLYINEIKEFHEISQNKKDIYIFLLNELNIAKNKRQLIGRKLLVSKAWEKGIFVTEQETRKILSDLNILKLISISKGRGGSKITILGENILEYLK